MIAKVYMSFEFFAVCVLFFFVTRPARAQVFVTHDTGKLIGITVGLAAIGAGVGVGVYAAVHHNHRLTGCAANGVGGLELWSPHDRQTYALVGEVSGIKPGERVRVSGKMPKGNEGVRRQFLVEKVEKDFGACAVDHAE